MRERASPSRMHSESAGAFDKLFKEPVSPSVFMRSLSPQRFDNVYSNADLSPSPYLAVAGDGFPRGGVANGYLSCNDVPDLAPPVLINLLEREPKGHRRPPTRAQRVVQPTEHVLCSAPSSPVCVKPPSALRSDMYTVVYLDYPFDMWYYQYSLSTYTIYSAIRNC